MFGPGSANTRQWSGSELLFVALATGRLLTLQPAASAVLCCVPHLRTAGAALVGCSSGHHFRADWTKCMPGNVSHLRGPSCQLVPYRGLPVKEQQLSYVCWQRMCPFILQLDCSALHSDEESTAQLCLQNIWNLELQPCASQCWSCASTGLAATGICLIRLNEMAAAPTQRLKSEFAICASRYKPCSSTWLQAAGIRLLGFRNEQTDTPGQPVGPKPAGLCFPTRDTALARGCRRQASASSASGTSRLLGTRQQPAAS